MAIPPSPPHNLPVLSTLWRLTSHAERAGEKGIGDLGQQWGQGRMRNNSSSSSFLLSASFSVHTPYPLVPPVYSPSASRSFCLLFLVIHILQKFEKKRSQISSSLPQEIVLEEPQTSF